MLLQMENKQPAFSSGRTGVSAPGSAAQRHQRVQEQAAHANSQAAGAWALTDRPSGGVLQSSQENVDQRHPQPSSGCVSLQIHHPERFVSQRTTCSYSCLPFKRHDTQIWLHTVHLHRSTEHESADPYASSCVQCVQGIRHFLTDCKVPLQALTACSKEEGGPESIQRPAEGGAAS